MLSRDERLDKTQKWCLKQQKHYSQWAAETVAEYLHVIDMRKYQKLFAAHDIRGDVLDQMTLAHLKEIGVKSLGDRLRIVADLQRLKAMSFTRLTVSPPSPAATVQDSPNLSSSLATESTTMTRSVSFSQQRNTKINVNTTFVSSSDGTISTSKRSDSKSPLSPTTQLQKSHSFFGSFRMMPTSLAKLKDSEPPTAVTSPAPTVDQCDVQQVADKLDVMSFESVRRNCIRVMSDEANVHVINVSALQSSQEILQRIYKKFNVDQSQSNEYAYALFVMDSNGNPRCLDDTELWDICKSEPARAERQRLVLQKVYHITDQKRQQMNQLRHKFHKLHTTYGDQLSGDLLKRQLNFPSPGDRPPSDVISFNLDVFFPGISDLDQERAIILNSMRARKRPVSLFTPVRGRLDSSMTMRTRPTSMISMDYPGSVRGGGGTESLLASIAESQVSDSDDGFDQPLQQIQWFCGDKIGQGSQGIVYYGQNIETLEIMAVKQVELPMEDDSKQGFAHRTTTNQQLESEIGLLKRLNHENIVKYLGSQVDQLHLTLFLEYVSGGSIASVIKKIGGPIPVNTVITYATQVLHGLTYLHGNGIIHRDIKGSNVLVTIDHVVKISDFGVSRLVDALAEQTKRRSVNGTVYWMCPEVFTGKFAHTTKIDIWSFGCLIVEMLTGKHPWFGCDPIPALYKIGCGQETPQTHAGPFQLDEQFSDLLEQCFAANPDDRPTAYQLIDHPTLTVLECAPPMPPMSPPPALAMIATLYGSEDD